MEQGWTKRWRKRWRNGYHRDLLLWALMDYFIDFAAYEPHKQFRKGIGLVELQRGEWVFSERELADFFGVDRGQIRVRLNLLSEMGFSTHETTQRATKIKVINYDVYQNNEPSDNPKINPATTQRQPTDNPPLNNKKERRKEYIPPEVEEIIYHLNIKTGKKFRPVGANAELVAARLKSGVTVEQCKAVIDRKVGDWLGDPKMDEFLRPETLFNKTKFESYLGAVERKVSYAPTN